MITLDEHPAHTHTDAAVADPDASRFDWEWQVMAVGAVWVFPGALSGALARQCGSDGGAAAWWLLSGAVTAATAGGLLEADH